MIGLVDPAFLLKRPSQHADREVLEDLDFIIDICRRNAVTLVPFEEYWPEMWRLFGRDLERSLRDPQTKQALNELRRLSTRAVSVPPPVKLDGVVWRRGFAQLFAWTPLGLDWEERMARAALRAVASGEQVILLVRRVSDRNLRIHTCGDSTIHENTRWVLYLQPRGLGMQKIPCIHHPPQPRGKMDNTL